MLKCEAKNAKGEPCGVDAHLVDQTTGYCVAHTPGGRQEMRRRGLKGGKRTKEAWRREGLGDGELGPLKSVEDAQRWLCIIGSACATGRLDKGDALAAIRAVEVWIRAAGELTTEQVEELARRVDHAITGTKPKLKRVP